MFMQNVFVYGLSGAGKDSISNYLRDYHGFMKLRIAGTIKQIICEARNLTFDELEEKKRTNPELRKLHNDVSKMLDEIAGFEQSSVIRLKMLIDGTAFDYQHYPRKIDIENQTKVICDCRTVSEAEMLLEANWLGMFLSRMPNEYRDEKHFTEQNMFYNGSLKALQAKFDPKLINIIFNNKDEFHPAKTYDLLPTQYSFKTHDDGLDALYEIVDIIDGFHNNIYKNKP